MSGMAIGIDLGTTYSCVAVFLNDRVEVIPNDQGSRITPSCVAFTESSHRLIGEAAVNQIPKNPKNSIFDAKRLIGRKFSDESVQSDIKLWPFEVVADSQDKPMIKVTYRNEEKLLAAEEISSMVLFKMKETAERYLGSEVKNAVITVPARFNDSQRSATKVAGAIAGLNVLRIINEPTAAAFAYGYDATKETKNVLIFDAGGGTCDVSILRIDGNNFEVKATAGDTHLGGEDLDKRLVSYFIEEIERKHRMNVRNNNKALWKLKSHCERAKRALSSLTYTNIEIESLDREFDFSATLTRAKFEELTMDLLEKFVEPVDSCLQDAGMRKGDINDVVLVGGCSRIPKVQELLRERFNGKKLSNCIHPDEAVASGAAVQAAILSGVKNKRIGDIALQDVTPLSLGILTDADLMTVVIPRNTPIPCKMEETFVTKVDNQETILVKVYEGERTRASDNNLLGEVTIDGIPPAPRGLGSVKECYEVDADGILHVLVTEVTTGNYKRLTITNDTCRLSKQDIERMIVDARKYKEEDDKFRNAMNAMNSLEWCVYRVKKDMKNFACASNINNITLKMIEETIKKADYCLECDQLEEEEYKEMEELLNMFSETFINTHSD